MRRDYHQWFSTALHRHMEMLVFGHAGPKVLVFPPRRGRFYDYENWGLVETLRPAIEQGRMELYCLDSVDTESLYARDRHPADRILRHQHYENYILEEVLPLLHSRNPHPDLIAHGCSLGAYHAANFAFRHPHLIRKLVALSGRFDLTLAIEHFGDLFDGFYNELIYYHTPSHYLPGLSDPALLVHLRRMEIILAVGEDDPFLENNRALSRTLWDKGIWNSLHFWPGRAHSPRHWLHMLPRCLGLAASPAPVPFPTHPGHHPGPLSSAIAA